MGMFEVNITETYTRTIKVEAEDQYDAYDKVDVLINGGEINLPCDGGNYEYERKLGVKEMMD